MLRQKGLRLLASVIAFTLVTTTAPLAYATPSSQEIVLAIDCSGSISQANYDIMIQGYANAFKDQSVKDLLTLNQGTAVQIVQFGGGASTTIGWHHITTDAESDAFALLVEGLKQGVGNPITARNCPGGTGSTNMAQAITVAAGAFGTHPSNRQVIDISTDGQPNIGTPSCPTVSAPVLCKSETITIAQSFQNNPVDILNTLGIGGGIDSVFLSNLAYGPNHFSVTVNSFAGFGQAVKDKLLKELEMMAVGGELLPINTTALLVAGLFVNVGWIIPAATAIAGAGAYFTRAKWLYTKE